MRLSFGEFYFAHDRKKNLITISMNYTLTPKKAIIFNASVKKRTNYLIPCEKSEMAKKCMVLAKCKKLYIRKIETPANLKIIRKIKFLQA